jgi:DNA-binding GntR family transcriptional regulator
VDGTASTREHRDVIAAVKAHDAARARSVMTNHITRAESRIIAALRSAGY